MKSKVRAWALWSSAVILILFVLAGGYASLHLGADRLRGLGNFEETVQMLPPVKEGSFRFAVMGDPEEGAGVWRGLMRRAHQLGAQFVVIAGDLVDRPTREAFEFFQYQYRALGPESLPTFAAVGNHDLSPEGLFEEYLGPAEFSFIHGDALFVFADNNRPEGFARCGRYVRREIERHRGRFRHAFIVVHKPLVDYRREGGELQRYRETGGYLFEVLDSEKVDAVLSAHYHGYLREAYRDTLLLVTGGAGARLHDAGAFHHMVLVDVGPDGIRDSLVRAEEGSALLDRLSLGLVVSVFPVVFGSWWRPLVPLTAAGVLLLLGLRLRSPRVLVTTPSTLPRSTVPGVAR